MTRRADIWRVRVPRPPCYAGSGASHCSPPPLKRRLLDFVKQLAMLAGMAEPDRIAAVRRFNRFSPRQIGVLRRTYLDSPYSLGEMRVLYELATGAMTATDIVRALDLDAGYVSRVLRNFEKKGLISRKASKEDARQSDIALTVAGHKMFAPFETRSNEQVGDMLAKLEAGQQDRLVRAMGENEKLLDGKAPREKPSYIWGAPRMGVFGWIVSAHAELYWQKYGGGEPFEGLCAQIVADFANGNDPQRERCWIAGVNGENAGCEMLVREKG